MLHRHRAARALPPRGPAFQIGEQRADDLGDRGSQVERFFFPGVMCANPKRRLAKAELARGGRRGEPQVDAHLRAIALPEIFGQQPIDE